MGKEKERHRNSVMAVKASAKKCCFVGQKSCRVKPVASVAGRCDLPTERDNEIQDYVSV